jgi:hypothetical protein
MALSLHRAKTRRSGDDDLTASPLLDDVQHRSLLAYQANVHPVPAFTSVISQKARTAFARLEDDVLVGDIPDLLEQLFECREAVAGAEERFRLQ